MVNLDYPMPCPTCGSKEECEHRIQEAKKAGYSAQDFESDVTSDVTRSNIDPHEIDESEKDIDKK